VNDLSGMNVSWIKGGSVVLQDEVRVMDIAIQQGKIASFGERIAPDPSNGERVIDASGLIVMPGMIDVHVHLNEPGLGSWEGFKSGSSALAAGGCTTYLDMPLNGIPPTVTVAAMNLKLQAAKGFSYIDYAIWGGLVPGKLHELAQLHDAGVIGYKAFMSSPGDPSEDAFREVDDLTLLEGMKIIARFGKVLALHAESEPIVSRIGALKHAEGKVSARDYTASRPIIAEQEAVNRALFYGEQTGCALHFVHISSASAIMAIESAKKRGQNVTVETCPHYLVLTEDDLENKGSVAKCSPPLRSNEEQKKLWETLQYGYIDMISSDHSPCPLDMKKGSDNFFDMWGGISGAQSSLELMVDEGFLKRGVPLPELARMLSLTPAKRFGLHPRKGEIRIGADADLAIINLNAAYTLEAQHLFQRHKQSPYVGRTISCKVVKTISNGQIVYDEKMGIVGEAQGNWIC
jgi:allantoinase